MPNWGKLLVAVTSGLAVGVASVYIFVSVTSKKRKRRLSLQLENKNGVGSTKRIIVLGLTGSGKSSIISRLSKVDREKRKISPTQGFNVLCLQISGTTYNIWEIGGLMKSYWTNFIEEADLLVYVLDATIMSAFEESLLEFNKLLADKRLKHTSVLLLANKQDLPGAKSPIEIEKLFGCHGGFVQGHQVRCLGTTTPADIPTHPSIWEVERLMLTLCHVS